MPIESGLNNISEINLTKQGKNTRLGARRIDGVTNVIDTNYTLYTATKFIKNAVVVVNNINAVGIKVRIAHVNGAIGTVTDKDYIFYDSDIVANGTTTIEIPSLIEGDTVLVRSDTADVNFMATGQTFDFATKEKLLAKLDIDGTTNLVDTDYEVYTATEDKAVNIVVLNRTAGTINYQVAHIDGAIGDIAAEDYILTEPLEANTAIFVSELISMSAGDTISLKSDTAEVNMLIYETTKF